MMAQKIVLFFIYVHSFFGFCQANYQFNPSINQLTAFLSTDGITIQQVQFLAGDVALQVALVSNAIEEANLAISEGLLFSTGDVATDIQNKNQLRNKSVSIGNYQDPDLLNIEQSAFYDPVVLEFEIQLSENLNTLNFTYQFGSEEYPDYVGSVYNDVFAIFFKEATQENYQNIATIPSSGNPVAVNYINGGVLGAAFNENQEVDLTQTNYYINNGHLNTGEINPANQPGPFPVHIEYNGITQQLSTKITNLTSETTYLVKFALADTADPNFDSGVLFSPITASSEEVSLTLLKEGTFTSLSNENRAAVGDVITYDFLLINNGDIPVYNLVFEDEMFPDANPFEGINVLPPESSSSFQLTYEITQQDINQGVVHNLATVRARHSNQVDYAVTSQDPTPLPEDHPLKDQNCLACTSVLIPQAIQIALIKRGYLEEPQKISEVGDLVIYTFDVHNLGNVDVFDLTIYDAMPGLQMEHFSFQLAPNEVLENVVEANYEININDIQEGEVENQAMLVGFTFLNDEVVDTSDFDAILHDRPTIVSLNTCELEVHDAITPNGDGINDFLYIAGIQCFPENKLHIFNRWGVAVFSATNYNNQENVFDGFSNGRVTMGSSEPLPDGVYYYVFQFTDLDGTSKTKKGSLYITRGR